MREYAEKTALREKVTPAERAYQEFLRSENQDNINSLNESFTQSQSQDTVIDTTGDVTPISFDDTGVEGDSIAEQMAGGVIDSANELLQATEEFSTFLTTENIIPDLGHIQVFDKQGNLDLDLISTDEKLQKGLEGVQLPTTPKPNTVSGSLVRGVTQFVSGFVPVAKALQVARAATKGQALRRGIMAAAITDFAFFDPHEERLANLLRDNFDLRDPITKFLKADPTDSSLEGRFKNVLEGFGIEAATGGALTAILKAYRGMRGVKNASTDQIQTEVDSLSKKDGVKAINVKEEKAVDIFKTKGKKLISDVDIDEDSLFDVKIGEGEKAFNVNLARIESTDDIKKIISNTGRVLDPKQKTKIKIDGTEATRGVQSNKETQALADNLGMSVDELLSRRRGEAFNAEQAVAARNLMVSSATNLEKMARKLKTVDATDVDRVAFRKAMNLHVAIQKEVSGLTAEAGRALQAFNIQAQGKREQIRAINDLLNSSGGRGRVDEMVDTFLDVVDRNPNSPAKINKSIDKLSRATTFDMVYEVWINSILSGPITHLVNMSSNALVALNRVPERAFAAGIGKLSKSNDGAEFGEVGAEIYGLMSGITDGWRMARESFVSEGAIDPLSKIETRQFRSITSENVRQTIPGKILGDEVLQNGGLAARFIDGLGTVVRFPGRMLSSEDAFFKGVNYRMELNAQAYRQATSEGLEGKELAARITEITENPTDSIRMEAMDKAHVNTFTDPNKFAIGISRATSSLPVSKFIIPFINTPSNIIKFSFERTPFAPLGRTFKEAVEAGGVRRDEALAKVAVGSSLMATMGYFTAQGRITGSPPNSFAMRNVKNKVLPPNSIRVGDKWYSYRRTDPFGMLVGLAADSYYISQEVDEMSFADFASMATLAASNNVLSKTWMTGVADFMEVMTSSTTTKGEASRRFTNYFNNIGSSFIPNFFRQTNVNFVDPYMREASTLSSKMLSKIPGFSKDLPLRRDIWGEARVYNLVEPVSDDKLNKFLAENNIGVSMPNRNITFAGGATRLTDKEYSRFVQLSRPNARKQLDKMLPKLEGLIAEDRDRAEEVIDKILRSNMKAGKARLLELHPEIIARIEREKNL